MVLEEREEKDLVMISCRLRLLKISSKLSRSSVCFSRFLISCSTFSKWTEEESRSGLIEESSILEFILAALFESE